tara:strand:+ start:54 stop:455 length:402 start_codon:yes stop_codon:yes gene_type:complete
MDEKYDKYIKMYKLTEQDYEKEDYWTNDNAFMFHDKLQDDIDNFLQLLTNEQSLLEDMLIKDGDIDYSDNEYLDSLNQDYRDESDEFQTEAFNIIDEILDYDNEYFKDNEDIILILKKYVDLQQKYKDKYKFT